MNTDCVFCNEIASGSWSRCKNSDVYHTEPLNPVTPGHRIFVPRTHVERPEINPAITGLVFVCASQWASQSPLDYNLMVNAGENASQSVKHLHVHYVPRAFNDGLVLPWTNQDRETGIVGGKIGDGVRLFGETEYREIPDYPGYLMNREGKVVNLKVMRGGNGSVWLTKGGRQHNKRVSHLIEKTFEDQNSLLENENSDLADIARIIFGA